MRISHLTLGLSLLFTGAGVFLYANAKPGPPANFSAPSRHYVTVDMERNADHWSQKVAPLGKSAYADGKPLDLASTLAKGPAFVYFIKDGCPCSVDAEPLFQRLYKKWGKQVSFVAVIDQKADKALSWSKMFSEPYGIVADPDQKVIKSFQATNSAFSALVSQDGKIVKMWPGYCRQYLLEMNDEFAKQLKTEPGTFDTAYAPNVKTAGCSFGPG